MFWEIIFEDAWKRLMDKFFDRDKSKGIVINQIHIGEIILNLNGKDNLHDDYRTAIDWLKREGRKIILNQLGNEEFSKMTIQFINNLPESVETATIEDFKKLAQMNLVGDKIIKGEKSFKQIIDNVLYFIEKTKDEKYERIIEKKLSSKDERIKTIKSNNLEQINIGGLIFILQTNSQYNKEKVFFPEAIGFKKVDGKNALVNLAIDGKIEIKSVTLNKGDDKNIHEVEIQLNNLTNEKCRVEIEKGQVFENKRYDDDTQNLASSMFLQYDLEPNQSRTINFTAYCLNRKMALPNGKHGNITFYSLSNKKFESGDQLWKIMNSVESKYQ